MWGKIALGATVVGAGLAGRFLLLQYGKKLQARGDKFLLHAPVQEIEVESGETVTALFVNIPDDMKTMLPIMAPKNRPALRPYARALNTLYYRGRFPHGGLYAVEIGDDGDYHVYFPYPIKKDEVLSEVPTEELVEKPQS